MNKPTTPNNKTIDTLDAAMLAYSGRDLISANDVMDLLLDLRLTLMVEAELTGEPTAV